MGQPEYVVDFPTLGDLVDAWIEQHCRVPDGFARKRPFQMADWQFWCTANHYRVREAAEWLPEQPLLNQAFVYRRSQVVAPQKTGKGPWMATITCVEAVGPCLFGGWAVEGDEYRCEDFGCACGWTYPYEAGEPKGIRHPSPLIQLTATSEDQVDNVYRPLTAMIRMGPLAALMKVREGFVRIMGDSDDPDMDRIDAVTSSAQSRLGNPITFAGQDETGLYNDSNKMRKTAETQRRGLAGMGGRSIETTNPWDPSENSVAQTTWESRSTDIFRFYREPPKNLSYRNKVERRKIHQFVYAGSWWVDLDSIEAEAFELLEKDPTQAERFFGNRVVYGKGSWLPDGRWDAAFRINIPQPGMQVCGGFDGSLNNDWSALRLETADGWQFTPTYGPDQRPTIWNPAELGDAWRGEVHAALDEVMSAYKIERLYCDVQYWESEIEGWARQYGEEHVLPWRTERTASMFDAMQRFEVDLATSRLTHDSCPITELHVANARKVAKPGQKYLLGKPADHQKIDAAMASILAHEAARNAAAEGWGVVKPPTSVPRRIR